MLSCNLLNRQQFSDLYKIGPDMSRYRPRSCQVANIWRNCYFLIVALCKVSFTDTAGIDHALDVFAEPLYEAAALGIVEFRRNGLAAATIGLTTALRVLSHPMAPRQYSLTLSRLESWARYAICKGPRQKVHRERVAQLLGLNGDDLG